MSADSRSKPEFAEQTESRGSDEPFVAADNVLTERIIGAAIEVHRQLGPGLLESAYEECLCYELNQRGIPFRRQVSIPVSYKGLRLDCGYRIDLLVDETIIVEIKAIDGPLAIHKAQVLTYLRVASKPIGLLVNFNEPVLKNGLKRIVNRYAGPAAASPSSASSAPEPVGGSKLDSPKESSPRTSPSLRVSAMSKAAATGKGGS